jgi:energy-coupling factor transporter ATP-binding protein EcfA2
MSGPALVLDGVVKRAGRRVVIEGASARFHPGELTAVRGPRGAGKTTLARLLAGHTHADSGRLRRAGTPAPLVGAATGFQSGAPVLRGLELRASAYGLDFRGFADAIGALLENPGALTQDFGRLVGRDRSVVVFAASYLIPAPIYVIDGSPLPVDAALRAKLRPLFLAARRRAAVIWIADEKARVDVWKPERLYRLTAGALHPEAAPVDG